MNNNNFFSLVFFLIFLVLFILLGIGFTFWSLGKIVVIVMVVIPIIGIVLAFKGVGWKKWILAILNIIALGSIVYILLLALGIGEI